MDPLQLVLQLGIAGVLIYFGTQIALVMIKSMRESDKERTAAIAVGFSQLVGSLQAHHTADLQAHTDMVGSISSLQGSVLEALAWQERTPVGMPPPMPPSVPMLPQQHPAVTIAERRTRPKGVPIVEGGAYSLQPRGKTNG